jgi:hypothetical protein
MKQHLYIRNPRSFICPGRITDSLSEAFALEIFVALRTAISAKRTS